MQGESGRDWLLTTLAVLMGLMAVSNFWKPIAQQLRPESPAGFVLFGTRLHGAANMIVGPLFGAVLATYAYGVWTMRRWVIPIAGIYAAYVIANLVLFVMIEPATPSMAFMLAYAVIAIGVSSGGAWLLLQRRDRLT